MRSTREPRISAVVLCAVLLAGVLFGGRARAAQSAFKKDNLVAWCVVPFDAAGRSPEERARLLDELGIRKLAYDWRGRHVDEFEREIEACRKHDIEFLAFWQGHPEFYKLVGKHDVHPQIWRIVPSPGGESREERVEAAAKELMPAVERTRELGCTLGLYNHGGWGGKPQNMVAVCEWLRENADADHVGIVYNFHHGHEQIDEWDRVFRLMKPYLLCLNLNGMSKDGPKILPIGEGEHEKEMIRTVVKSDYTGPIGILDHRPQMDAEKSLRQNLSGLRGILRDIGAEKALETYGN